jgi:transcriptional regulator with XRE-family HTH domain
MANGMPQRIASARHEAGFHRVEQFAEAIGVSDTAVRKWERGDSRPSHANLERIAALTNKPIGYFYGEEQASVADALERVQRLLQKDEITILDPNGTAHHEPLIDLPIVAAGTTVRGVIAVPRMLLPTAVPHDHLAVAHADAAAPDMNEGDMLLVDRRDRDPDDGSIVVAEDDGEIVVREVYRAGELRLLLGKQGHRGRVLPEAILGRVVRIVQIRDLER